MVLGCAYTIFTYGSETLKKKYIPNLCSADLISGFAITEPDAGSDGMAIASTAEDKGDHWLLNGAKTWISNADVATRPNIPWPASTGIPLPTLWWKALPTSANGSSPWISLATERPIGKFIGPDIFSNFR